MRITLKSVLTVATLGVALPVTAAGIGGAAAGAAGAAGRADMGGVPDINIPSQADMGAAAAGRAGAGIDAAGRAGAATEALGGAGASNHAIDTVGESPANSRANQALESSGPAEAGLNAPAGADVNASDDHGMGGTANAHASLTGKVQSTLHSNSELRGLNIKSEIAEDGSVTLNGTVKNSDQKDTAEELVANIEGVSTVNSNLTVEGN